jgi:serine/threonine protein kinase
MSRIADWLSVWPVELAGRYEPVRLLCSGKRSSVIAARDREGASFAVKLPIAEGRDVASSKSRKAIKAEGEILGRVSNDRIVHLVEAATDGEYLILEYLRGGTVFQRYSSRRPTVLQALEFASSVAAGLHALHRSGFLHLDLKPRNILFRDGTNLDPVVIDFGCARPIEKPIGLGTIDPKMIGSGSYLFKAPEQLMLTHNTFFSQTDAFALGVTLYWLLDGNSPFSNLCSDAVTARNRMQHERDLALARCRTMNLPACAIRLLENLLEIEITGRVASLDGIAEALRRCAEAAV